jgi:hypothetical protein
LNGGKTVYGIRGSNGRFIRKGFNRRITGKESRRRLIAVLGEEIFSSREADVGCDDTAGTSCIVVERGRHMRRDGRGRQRRRWRRYDGLGGTAEDEGN